jgi:hypothetical protein
MLHHAPSYQKQLDWRIKQIHIGKSSSAYTRYVSAVPRTQRCREHPLTPDPYDAKMSKRQFEGRVRAWKREITRLTSPGIERCLGSTDQRKKYRKCNLFLKTSEVAPLNGLNLLDSVNLIYMSR